MRCLACNVALSDVESTNHSALTGDFIDMCTSCIRESGIEVAKNPLSAVEELRQIEEATDERDPFAEEYENDSLGG